MFICQVWKTNKTLLSLRKRHMNDEVVVEHRLHETVAFQPEYCIEVWVVPICNIIAKISRKYAICSCI